MAERKGRKTEVFLPCRGTNFEKTSKNAHDSRPEPSVARSPQSPGVFSRKKETENRPNAIRIAKGSK